ncbi:hypothetical protein CRENBAI_012269 [Crenichthys baileyi]|uniref:Uncharacterized protein n=1 Tax=Crenichthys baileyi TaxID=28760 RepID=A0AAV9R0D9_9TELE
MTDLFNAFLIATATTAAANQLLHKLKVARTADLIREAARDYLNVFQTCWRVKLYFDESLDPKLTMI